MFWTNLITRAITMVTRDSLGGWQTWRCWGNVLALNKNTFAAAVLRRIFIYFFPRSEAYRLDKCVWKGGICFLFYILMRLEFSCKANQLTQLMLASSSAAESATNELIRRIIQNSQDHCVHRKNSKYRLLFQST